jgi:hypothetical protein
MDSIAKKPEITEILLHIVKSNPLLQYVDEITVFQTTISFSEEFIEPSVHAQTIVFENANWLGIIDHHYSGNDIDNKWSPSFHGKKDKFWSWLNLVEQYPSMRSGLVFDLENIGYIMERM